MLEVVDDINSSFCVDCESLNPLPFQVVLVIVALIVGIELSPRGSVKENTSLKEEYYERTNISVV